MIIIIIIAAVIQAVREAMLGSPLGEKVLLSRCIFIEGARIKLLL